MRFFVDGSQIGSDGANSESFFDGAAVVTTGARDDGVLPLNGWIDEVRFSNGVARWTSNFTPLSTAYS